MGYVADKIRAHTARRNGKREWKAKGAAYDLPAHEYKADDTLRTVIVVEDEYEGEHTGMTWTDYVVLVYLPHVPEGIAWSVHGSLGSAKRTADRVARQKKLWPLSQ